MRHRDRSAWWVAAAMATTLTMLPLLSGCATPAEAAPLEVTYYYMPG